MNSKLFWLLLVLSISCKQSKGQMQLDPVSYCQEPGAHHEHLFSCCNGVPYLLGHTVEYHLLENCVHKRADQNLNYTDSFWDFYKCVVTQALGTNQLTLSSFAKLMAVNLEEKPREDVLWYVRRHTLNDSLNEVDRIKTMWEIYFDADYKVCSRKFDPDEFGKRSLEKGVFVNTGSPPTSAWVIKFPSLLNSFGAQTCFNITLHACNIYSPVLGFFCTYSRPNGISFKDLERNDMDFEGFLNQISPPFISLSAREAYNAKIAQIIMTLGNFNQNPNDLFKNITQDMYEKLPIETLGLDQALIEILVNLQPVEMIRYAVGQVRSVRTT